MDKDDPRLLEIIEFRKRLKQEPWDTVADGDIFDAARPLIEEWEREIAMFEARKSTKH
jgi:hypothetical protein